MMATCEEARRLIVDFPDRRLGLMKYFSAQFRLMMCGACLFCERIAIDIPGTSAHRRRAVRIFLSTVDEARTAANRELTGRGH